MFVFFSLREKLLAPQEGPCSVHTDVKPEGLYEEFERCLSFCVEHAVPKCRKELCMNFCLPHQSA
jgi:hypothetical protein